MSSAEDGDRDEHRDLHARMGVALNASKGINPYTVAVQNLQPGVRFVDLPPEARALIRHHTRSHFVVEQRWNSNVHGILDSGGHVVIPVIQSIEFQLAPRTTYSHPTFSMKMTQRVDRQSPEFTRLIAGLSVAGLSEEGLTTLTQEERQRLTNWALEHEKNCQETFHAIARLVVHSGLLLVVEPEGYSNDENWRCRRRFVRTPGNPDLYVMQVPDWFIVSTQALQEIRQNLQSKFHMQLEQIP